MKLNKFCILVDLHLQEVQLLYTLGIIEKVYSSIIPITLIEQDFIVSVYKILKEHFSIYKDKKGGTFL